jgi:amino acid adenylation domain-containing protein
MSTSLSSTQREIWFNQILHPKLPLYNLGGYLRIDGAIEPAIFEKALNQVIKDNDALRIRIQDEKSLPTQTFVENIRIKLDFHDFSAKANAHESALAWMKSEFGKPFQLYNKPLFQFALFKITANSYYSFQKYHHLIVDGWAISLIVQSLATAYNRLTNKQSNKEQKHYSYQNFLQNDQAYLDSEKFIKAKDYWLSKYREIPEPLLMRRYGAQFADQNIPSQLSILLLKRPFYNQLVDLASKNKVSTFHVILGALYCYFSKATAQKDMVIGLPILNRRTAAFKQTVGLFTNVIPARFHFGLDLNFVELMQAIAMELRQDYRHQRLPISEINRGLHLTQRRQLFDIMLSYEKHDYDTHFNGSPAQAINFTHGFNQNALEIYIREFHQSQDVRVDFEYNLGFFDSLEIELIKARFEFLLGEILRQPDVPIRKLRIRCEAEMSATRRVHPTNPFIEFPKHEHSIPARFEQQVKQYPNQIAVKTQRYEWTYQHLNDKANQVAQHLLDACQVSVQVALLFEHDAPMLAAIMGVLKAGKTYVPLAPDFPRERLEYMVQDSQAGVILTNNQNLSLAQSLINKTIRLINIDDLDSTRNNIYPTVSPDSIAYILYTSGSTGRPKGVIQNHRNVLHFIRTYTNNLHITTDDKLTLLSFYSFDAAMIDIFAALLNGATLYPINLKEETFTTLSAWLIQQQITIYHSTPTVYRHWLNTLTSEENFSQIRLIILGGEPVYKSDVDGYQKHFSSDCLFINGLGSTESSFSLQYFIDKQTKISRNEVPVGYPIENTEILLLDETGVETEVYGEIAIKSPYLALGYWQQPELTQAVFITKDKQRLYRSGDIGRVLPYGSLEFVDRKDFQIKWRGFRIELGEIEASLSQHEAVKEAVVVLDNILIAYVTLTTQIDEMSGKLRTWLKSRLPEYMLPASFTVLDQLPLTPNGKIDRKALPAPSIEIKTGAQPQTPTEDLLAGLWASVLKRQTINRDDNFFELGGHSLLATQLIARIRDRFQIELPMRAVFEHPQLASLATAIEAATGTVRLPPIEVQPDDSPKMLSFAQQRLWFLNQFEENNSATYNMPAALQLSGRLDMAALQQSLLWLLERHASLRTYFPTRKGQASVQIQEIDQIDVLQIHDLRHLSASDQNEEVQSRANQNAIEPFDLAQGPLFRASLLQLSEQRSVLLLNMHHIISDGWSMGIFIRDFQHAYTAFIQGTQPSQSPLLIQYSDYAAWQRHWFIGSVLQQQVDYWHQQLAGCPELLELPTDKPRPPQQSYQGAHYSHRLSATLLKQVSDLSREQGVSVFMTLLSTFFILLSRYSRQDDLCVGSPIANRTHRQTEELIGFFVNTLVLRSQLKPEPNVKFTDLLQATRKTCLEAYAHQDIPFERLVEQLQPTRHLSQSPLFQVMFVLQNTESVQLPGLEVTVLKPDYPIAKFDLTLSIEEQAGQWHCIWEYATDLFEASTIERMAQHFEVLLTAIVDNSEQSISHLPMLTEQEVQQLQAWNDTATDYPADKTIIDLFEQQVEKTPENIAVVFEEQQLTYQQLNEKANQLAHYLLSIKTQTGAVLLSNNPLIAIAVERSVEMVIGLLGILKAGGAYVPIDPSYPAARVRYMLEDSAAPLLLTQSHLKDELEPECVVVCLDEATFALESIENPDVNRRTEDLAYVIYTSGSTGEPKGVMVDHKALSNYVFHMHQHFVHEGRFAWLSTIAADLGNTIIFGALCSGGTLCVIDQQCALDARCLNTAIKQYEIDYLKITPTHLMSLQTQDMPIMPTRLLIVGGEASSVEWFNTLRQQYPHCYILNHYGPTEATVGVTTYLIDEGADQNTMFPIGKPISNTHIYILDKTWQPLPPGIPGELCIAGRGLARGYIGNRPKLTAEKFLEVELFGKTERIYKTGDLARWREDGNLEYLGRLDHQVKLRGFRIELGEIEAVLSQHKAVKEAVVILYEADENKRLVAYLTIAQESTVDAIELKEWLKARLPDYMVPSHFTVLDKLPLTANGKIDRQALPAPDAFSINKDYQAPRDKVELQLVQIWENVLKVSPISIFDNFFELGGHSLLAVRLMAQIEQQFNKHLPLTSLFQGATIEQLANQLRLQTDNQAWSSLVAIQPNGTQAPLFCVPGVGGNVVYFYELAHHLGPDQPFYGLQAVGLDGKSAPLSSIEEMAAHYLKELQTIQPQGPYLLGGHSFGGLVAFEMSLQLQKQGHEVAFLGIFDSMAPPYNAQSVEETQWLNQIAQFIERELGQKLAFNYDRLQSLDTKAQLDYLFNQLKPAGFLPANAPKTQLRGLINVFKANRQIHYAPVGITKTPITLFKAEQSDVFENWGWEKFSENGVSVQVVPGDHFSMMRKPQVQILAAQLKEELEQASYETVDNRVVVK